MSQYLTDVAAVPMRALERFLKSKKSTQRVERARNGTMETKHTRRIGKQTVFQNPNSKSQQTKHNSNRQHCMTADKRNT